MKIAVLGGGPGGYVAAIRAAQLGAEVTLIEAKDMGGTCLNVGCIPTKVLLHTAEIYGQIKGYGEIGLDIPTVQLNWDKLQRKKTRVVRRLVGGINALLKSNDIRVVNGKGYFLNPNQIEVKLTNNTTEIVDYDYAIIAVGSEAIQVPIEGAELEGVINSNQALSLDKLPNSICVIGGGVIGTEFASIYNELGSEVTVVEILPKLLGNMDEEIVKILETGLKKKKIDINLSSKVKSIKRTGDKLEVEITNDKGEKIVEVDKVLMATGRKPNTAKIGLENLGVRVSGNAIDTNEKMQTNITNVYAVGDCTGGVMLAHVASAQGIVAAEAIMGMKSDIDFKTTPSCVYTKPELASVGLSEKEAREAGYEVKTGKFPFMANGKAMIMQETQGLVKFVADKKNGEVLGLHIVGPRATDLIAEGSLAIRLEATIDEIITTIHGHPTVNEAIAEAAQDFYDNSINMLKK